MSKTFKCWATRDKAGTRYQNKVFLFRLRPKPFTYDGEWMAGGGYLINGMCHKGFFSLTGVKLKPGEKKLISITMKEVPK